MPKYSEDSQAEHLAMLREIKVVNPDVSCRKAVALLEKLHQIHLDYHYVNKLLNKIRRERANRINHATLNAVLSEYQDVLDLIAQKAWKVYGDKGEKNNVVKLRALKEIREAHTAVFDKLFDAGVFERNLGKLKTGEPLTPEDQEKVNQALGFAYGKPPEPTGPAPAPDNEPEGKKVAD